MEVIIVAVGRWTKKEASPPANWWIGLALSPSRLVQCKTRPVIHVVAIDSSRLLLVEFATVIKISAMQITRHYSLYCVRENNNASEKFKKQF
jgi:hypothetical protein